MVVVQCDALEGQKPPEGVGKSVSSGAISRSWYPL